MKVMNKLPALSTGETYFRLSKKALTSIKSVTFLFCATMLSIGSKSGHGLYYVSAHKLQRSYVGCYYGKKMKFPFLETQ